MDLPFEELFSVSCCTLMVDPNRVTRITKLSTVLSLALLENVSVNGILWLVLRPIYYADIWFWLWHDSIGLLRLRLHRVQMASVHIGKLNTANTKYTCSVVPDMRDTIVTCACAVNMNIKRM